MGDSTDPAPLPLDPDVEVEATADPSRPPVHLRPASLALVFLGGMLGTAAREAVTLAWPRLGGVPVAILLVNLTGAFLLGVLLEALARRGADEGRRRRLRLLFGTGAMGGFTTYSALASDTALLLAAGDVATAIAYGLGTVAIGALATWAGIAVASASRLRRTESR